MKRPVRSTSAPLRTTPPDARTGATASSSSYVSSRGSANSRLWRCDRLVAPVLLRLRAHWTGWGHLPEVDAAGLLTDVDRRHLLASAEVDHVHRARLRADPLLRDERVAVVARHGRAVHDAPRRRNSRQLGAARDVDDRRRLPALVRRDEQLAVVRHGEVVHAVARRDAAHQSPRRATSISTMSLLLLQATKSASCRRPTAAPTSASS